MGWGAFFLRRNNIARPMNIPKTAAAPIAMPAIAPPDTVEELLDDVEDAAVDDDDGCDDDDVGDAMDDVEDAVELALGAEVDVVKRARSFC